MKMTKKVLTTSLAASLVLGSVAGLPLNLGVEKANASATTPLPSSASEIKVTLNEIYAELSENDKKIISDARDEVLKLWNKIVYIDGVPTQEAVTTMALVDPIWNQVQTKIRAVTSDANATSYGTVNKETVFFVVMHLAIQYDPEYKALEALRTSEYLRPVLNDLAKLGGITNGMDGVDFADFIAFAKEMQNAAINSITSATTINDLLNAEARAKTAIKNVLAATTTKTGTALRSIGITDEALLQTKTNFETVTGTEADRKFAEAYLKVLIKKIPTTSPSTGGIVVTTPPQDATSNSEVKLGDVVIKLEEMLNDKGNGLAKAVEAIENALREAARVDVSSTVKVEGGVAKPTFDLTKLADAFKSAKELKKSANDQLNAASSEKAEVTVVATLDLGTVDANEVQIPLSKELLAQAKENGVDALALKVNGVVLAIEVDQLTDSTTLSIKKEDKSIASAVTNQAIVSEVYNFTFESNGSTIESFSKPVEVRVPANANGVDSELLVFAKLDNGELVLKGGKYDAEKKEFIVLNKSFSTYAVIENKVSFLDTKTVEEWAGRQISVAAAKGILEGRAEGEFVPNGKVTRAEFAKMIVKTFGLEDATATEAFVDVTDSDWYKVYVASAVKAGIIEGRTENSFAPDATITRAEMATMASRALTKVLGYKAVEGEAALKFADTNAIHATLKTGVALAAEQGIVVGEEGNQFNPNNDSTRAQAAVVIYRLLNK